MPWTTGDKVMELRARNGAVDVAVETLDGWRRHLSGRNASVLSFFSFLTIFPLMLAATTILGFVLQDNEELQEDIVDGALADIPVLGQQRANDPSSLTGRVVALLIGLLGALWSSTKAFVGLQGALDDVWEIDVDDRPSMPVQRGKALLGIAIIGAAQVGNVAISSIVQEVDLPAGGRILLVIATATINVVVLATMYRFLTSADPSYRDVWPGAIVAGTVITGLQYFGTWIVTRITQNASDTYGNFALVLGLVTWLGLIAITTIMCAELNAALVRRRSVTAAGRTANEGHLTAVR
jgi:YihY family inner membrane protein